MALIGRAGTFTIRPEKIHVLETGEQPEPGANVEEGTVRDVSYVGPVTRYHVALERGGELQVLSQNLEESSSDVLARLTAPMSATRPKAGADTVDFDPYNTGAFNRSTSWERISRHKR